MISLKDVYAAIASLARMTTATLAGVQNMYIHVHHLKIRFRLQFIQEPSIKCSSMLNVHRLYQSQSVYFWKEHASSYE